MLSLTHILRFGLALAVPAFVVACGDQTANAAPILDSVDAPLVVSEQNGTYTVPVTLFFHDNDGDAVTHLRYRLAPNIDRMVDVPAANPSRETSVVTLVISAADLDGSADGTAEGNTPDSAAHSARPGTKDDHDPGRASDRTRARGLQLNIVDGRGAESLPQTSNVTLD